jgi:hypothetical protein
MGGVRRERSSPAAAKGANSCGAGPQGLTLSSAPRPRGTYELSLETEEAEVQGCGGKVEAALARDGETVVSDDRPQARRVRQVWRQAGRRRRGCVSPRAPRDAVSALCRAARGFEGLSPVDPMGAQAAGGAVRSVSKPHSPRRVIWTGGVPVCHRPRPSVPVCHRTWTNGEWWGLENRRTFGWGSVRE